MGVAASQMERRGIATEKGDINRQIAADNKLLKEIKARITRIYNWTKEQAEIETPQGGGSLVARLYEAQAEVNRNKARSGKVKALQENAKLLAFLQSNGIESMEQLYEKVATMNSDYYDLRGKIVKTERRLAVLDERLEMWAQYEKYKPIRQKLDKLKPGKREKYQQERRERIMAAHPSLPPDPVDTRTEEEKEQEQIEAINGLMRGAIQFFEHFLNGLQMYQGMTDDFAAMPAGQIRQVWHIVGLVDMALRRFIKEIKAATAEKESESTADKKGKDENEN